jgi:hypothetical protein
MTTLAEVKAREEELEREWFWLVEALNTVARVRAEQGLTLAAWSRSTSQTLHGTGCQRVRSFAVKLPLERRETDGLKENVRAAYQTSGRKRRIQRIGEKQIAGGPLRPHGPTEE